jgi:hypothetical protein
VPFRADASTRPKRPVRRTARTHEELGLEPAKVTILGEADPYRTVTGYQVTPVVGLIPPDLSLNPNPAEVEAGSKRRLILCSIPPTSRRMSAEFRGRIRHYYQIDWQDRRIWGATAAMLVNLGRRLS